MPTRAPELIWDPIFGFEPVSGIRHIKFRPRVSIIRCHFGSISGPFRAILGDPDPLEVGGVAPRPSRDHLYWVRKRFVSFAALRNFDYFRFLGFGFLFGSFLFARLHHFGTVSEHSWCSRPPQRRRGGWLVQAHPFTI